MPNDILQSYTLAAILKWEQENLHSREKITVLAAQELSPGSVLGQVTVATAPTTGTGVGTGNGTMTGVTAGRSTIVGTYTATCITVDTNVSTWSVKNPNGAALPAASNAIAYTSSELNFTINDGATDFIVGDTFTIAVTVGGLQHRAVSFSAVDGSARVAGLAFATYDASASGDRIVSYTSGGTYEILPGDTITGATSGSTARVVSLTLATGTWAGGDAAGVLTLDDRSGALQSENLNVGGNSNVATIGGDSSAVAAADIEGVAIVRDAEIVDSELTWPSGATTAQKATALAELAALGIIVRVEA